MTIPLSEPATEEPNDLEIHAAYFSAAFKPDGVTQASHKRVANCISSPSTTSPNSARSLPSRRLTTAL